MAINNLYSAIIFNGDVTTWDTSKVTNMRKMLKYTYDFILNISDWNVDNVLDMTEIFYDTSFDKELCWDLTILSPDTDGIFDKSTGCIINSCCVGCESDILCD